jgi:excinuclease ABC subunit C
MVDRRGEFIYVGKAKCLRARLLSYFRSKSRDPKAGRILRHTRRLNWEPASSEFAALLRELELIRRWQPRFNVQGQPKRRRRLYVCIGRKPAPYVYLRTHPPANAQDCYGPVLARDEAREAVRRLNDCFGLRDCPQSQPMFFADQKELFTLPLTAGCLRHEIGACLGPCVGECTRSDYHKRVRAVRHFLMGNKSALLGTLETEMEAASESMLFERAAVLRDKLAALTWLRNQLNRIKQMRQRQSFIYPIDGVDGQQTWYFIHGGQVMAALPAPIDNESRRKAAKTAHSLAGKPLLGEHAVPVDDLDGLFLVATWFRRHDNEKSRLLDLKTLEPSPYPEPLFIPNHSNQ